MWAGLGVLVGVACASGRGNSMRAGLGVLVGVVCFFSVAGQEDRNIYAPFEYLDKTERWLYRVSLGPSAWICGTYQDEETWEIYDLIDEYINSRNGKMMDLRRTTWPSIRTVPLSDEAKTRPKKNAICHYIERELHCDVPTPMDGRLYPVNKIPQEQFYMKEFWGQANDRRLNHYIPKMFRKMDQLGITNADRSFYIVGYFDDNLKGLMFRILNQ